MPDNAENAPTIEIIENGPYVVRNVAALTNSKGEALEAGERVALCRCGASENKPFCDGGHKQVGFTDDRN